jgi:hypothetical protein
MHLGPEQPPCGAAGLHDSADDALRYIRAVAPDGWAELEEPLWQTFVEQAPEMLSFIERRTSLRFGLGGGPIRTWRRRERAPGDATSRRGRIASLPSVPGGIASGLR